MTHPPHQGKRSYKSPPKDDLKLALNQIEQAYPRLSLDDGICRMTGAWGFQRNIRRPPFGGHQAARSIGQTACSKSLQSFQSQVDSQVSIHFQSFPIVQSAISSLPVWYQLLAVCKSAIWGLVTVYCRPGTVPLPPPGCILSTWVPPGYP